MTINESGLTALRITFAAIRTPWDLVNEHVVARAFGAESTAHRTLTQGLQTFDALAQKALTTCAGGTPDTGADNTGADDTGADNTGDTSAEPIAVPSVASEPTAVRHEQPIDRDEQQEISDLANSYLAEQQYQNLSGELAEDDEVRRAQAEIRAKQAIEDEHGQL